jgi:lipopolysaccharide heptosyltransferase II
VATAGAKALPSNVCLSVPVRRVVTFHLNGLSDLLFTLPALAALRESLPGAAITSVVRPSLAPILEAVPYVDEVWARPKGGLSAQASLMARLHAHHFDIAVVFSQSRNMALLAWSSGASVRAGYVGSKMETLLTHRVPREGPSRIALHLELVRELGCKIPHLDYGGLLHPGTQAQKNAQTLLDEAGIDEPFILVSCAASEKRSIKEWGGDQWAEVVRDLSRSWPIVLAGTAPTPRVSRSLGSMAPGPDGAPSRVWDFGGRTDVLTLAALCGMARLFVGIDSGVLHMAAAMQTPVVGLYGPSDPHLTGPRGVPQRIVRHEVECSPCLLSECPREGVEHRKCLTRLAPESVVRAVRELMLETPS